MTLTLDRTPVPTGAFPTVPLEDLNAQAGLQSRIDRKYLLRAEDVPALLDSLPHGTRVLEITGHRTFGYSSTYFDTQDLHCYTDAARRRRHRFKVRTRLYTDSGLCHLEVKTRDGRRRTVKFRLPCRPDEQGLLTPAGRSLICSTTGSDAWAPLLRPALLTNYRRTTLLLPHEATRLTVDVDLTLSQPGGDPVCVQGLAIVETKGGHSPTTADRALWNLGHRPTKISKYGTGLALLRPELPSNKWHRTLERIRTGQGDRTGS